MHIFLFCAKSDAFSVVISAMEFGSVICEGVELGDIPIELQEANVFKLRLTNNGMHSLPDNRLAGTGKI